MRMFTHAIPAVVVLTLFSAPVLASGAAVPGAPGELAFTLDEMNCFSSDIHAREVVPPAAARDVGDVLLAAGSSGGTNGIPCSKRDPKAAPKKQHS